MENELIPILKELQKGIVLDVGSKDSPYKTCLQFTDYRTLDISKKSNPDYVADLHDLSKLPEDHFDVVIATEVFEHLYDPQKAAEEIRRILKRGGVCIVTTRFFYHYHPDPKDYYRFTWDSLKYIFRDFKEVEVKHHGNYIQTMWQIINTGRFGFILDWFNPLFAGIKSKRTEYPLGFIVKATK